MYSMSGVGIFCVSVFSLAPGEECKGYAFGYVCLYDCPDA